MAGTLGDKVVIEQADIKNAYLNSLLHNDEEIYMYHPWHYNTFWNLPTKFTNRLTGMIIL